MRYTHPHTQRPASVPSRPMRHDSIPTSRLGYRVAGVHDRLLATWPAFEQVADRRAPASPELVAEVAPLLVRARLLLSRHRLQGEIPPLPAGEPVMPGDLFVRVTRAMLALGTLFEELIDLSPRQ